MGAFNLVADKNCVLTIYEHMKEKDVLILQF